MTRATERENELETNDHKQENNSARCQHKLILKKPVWYRVTFSLLITILRRIQIEITQTHTSSHCKSKQRHSFECEAFNGNRINISNSWYWSTREKKKLFQFWVIAALSQDLPHSKLNRRKNLHISIKTPIKFLKTKSFFDTFHSGPEPDDICFSVFYFFTVDSFLLIWSVPMHKMLMR